MKKSVIIITGLCLFLIVLINLSYARTIYFDIDYNGGDLPDCWMNDNCLVWWDDGNSNTVPPPDICARNAIAYTVGPPNVDRVINVRVTPAANQNLRQCPGNDADEWTFTLFQVDFEYCVDSDHDGYNVTGGGCGPIDCNDNNASLNITKSCAYNKTACGNFNLCISSCPVPPEEICDRIDNNCNNEIDEGGVCQPPGTITAAKWKNMINEEISQADLNDSVKLTVEGENLQGKKINYTIYKELWYWFDTKIAEGSSLEILWRAGKKADGSLESGTYYFKARTEDGLSNEFQSGNLLVSSPENNSKPVAIIINPKYREVYKRSTAINFTQASYDIDDEITIKWRFGDNINSTAYNTTHTYSSDGKKDIILEVTDSRGLKDEDKTSILVCGDGTEDSTCVFADIFKPRFGEIVSGRLAELNASRSFAILHSRTGAIICFAGLCPGMTADGTLITGTPNWTGFQNMKFNWTIIEKNNNNLKSYFNGLGRTGAVFTRQFNYPANLDNPHKAFLTAELTANSQAETEFGMNFQLAYCDYSDNEHVGWWEEILGVNQFIPWDSDNYNCYRSEVDHGVNECCPISYDCDRASGECLTGGMTLCQQFTEESCSSNSNHPDVAESELEGIASCNAEQQYGDLCFEKTTCSCNWNGTECKAVSNHTISKGSTYYSYPLSNADEICQANSTILPPILGLCQYTTEFIDNCNVSGNKIASWTAYWTGTGNICADNADCSSEEACRNGKCTPRTCEDGTRSIPCISGALLSFFNLASLAIALAIIIIFYIIVYRKKKK